MSAEHKTENLVANGETLYHFMLAKDLREEKHPNKSSTTTPRSYIHNEGIV
jgi:hypothetical protein